MKSRTVSILDPMPIPHTFKGFEPTLYYVHKIKNIANNLKLAMQVLLGMMIFMCAVGYYQNQFQNWMTGKLLTKTSTHEISLPS